MTKEKSEILKKKKKYCDRWEGCSSMEKQTNKKPMIKTLI